MTDRLRVVLVSAAMSAVVGASCLSGCAHVDNDRLVVSNIAALDTDGGAPFDPEMPYRQTTTFGRHNWTPVRYVVANDTTIHGPTYAPLRDPAEATERQRAAYPTLDGAFDFTGGSEPLQIRQGFTEPILTLVDVILIIPRAIVQRPLSNVESPAKSYQRDHTPMSIRPAIRQVEAPVEQTGDETGEPGMETPPSGAEDPERVGLGG
jgi:hypothetical protein